MEISMTALAWEFLYAIVLGAFWGIVYDVVRLLRMIKGVYKGYENKEIKIPDFFKKYMLLPKKRKKKIKSNALFVVVGDILFFVIAACSFSVFVYHFNDGTIRGFVLLGALLGLFAYYFTVGKLVMFLSYSLVYFVKRTLTFGFFLVIFPFLYVFEKICGAFCILICKMSLIICKVYVIMYIHKYSIGMHRRIVSLVDGFN